MKKIMASVVFILSLSAVTHAQETTPQLLPKPANWEFERFPLPPAFAPAITYKGVEELRFSPGMFHKDSASYFSYAFVAQLDDVTAISQTEVHDYLFHYFKGLCTVTAKDRKLVIDTSGVKVMVEKMKGANFNDIVYNASLNIFGVFQDGPPVKLNAEVKVMKGKATKKIYLIFIASPRQKTDPIWRELYQIQKDFKLPQ